MEMDNEFGHGYSQPLHSNEDRRTSRQRAPTLDHQRSRPPGGRSWPRTSTSSQNIHEIQGEIVQRRSTPLRENRSGMHLIEGPHRHESYGDSPCKDPHMIPPLPDASSSASRDNVIQQPPSQEISGVPSGQVPVEKSQEDGARPSAPETRPSCNRNIFECPFCAYTHGCPTQNWEETYEHPEEDLEMLPVLRKPSSLEPASPELLDGML
ncbi:hypothetical protein H0H81_000911 [Sphagnurus paluster]|uniref:Uncharacterized protein n=1 Tax=Sphagnurus paluster TaxID=117069 RepID=A0A9P7K7Y5_9AGAR|nr:hypothetical protein H0H81_000911 [Sphagnurus paluster]